MKKSLLEQLEDLEKNTNIEDFKKLMQSDAKRRAKKKKNNAIPRQNVSRPRN